MLSSVKSIRNISPVQNLTISAQSARGRQDTHALQDMTPHMSNQSDNPINHETQPTL